jgi:hypothetical protein
MISHEHIRNLQQEQARIDAARAAFLAKGNTVQVLDSYEFKPAPPRTTWRDPETVLKRRPGRITLIQRQMLRRLAEAL